MKSLKISLLSLAAAVIAIVGMSFKPSVNDNTSKKWAGTLSYQFTSATNFGIGSTPSTPLSTASNYTTQAFSDVFGSSNMHGVTADYPNATAPSQSQVLTEVKAEYDRLLAISQATLLATFVNQYQWTKNFGGSIGIVTFKVYIK
jgi:hypothetical protein